MRPLLEHQSEVVSKAVRTIDPDVVLNTPGADLVNLIYEKYRVEPIVLDLAARRSSGAKDVSIPIDSWSGRGGSRAVFAAGPRLVSLLALNGLRISEALGADIDDLGLERGHRTLVVHRQGGKTVTIPLAPRTARAVDRASASACPGPTSSTATASASVGMRRRGWCAGWSSGRGSPSALARTASGTRSSPPPRRWRAPARRAGGRLARRSSHNHPL